jgi:uncharacterized membrane protein
MATTSTAQRGANAADAAGFNWRWAIILILSTVIGLGSLRYLAGQDMAPPPLLPNFLNHHTGFMIHISLGTAALLSGPWQFSDRLRSGSPRTHRMLGWIYVFSCTVGGVAGLLIASGSNGGPIAATGFSLLALLWIGLTLLALRAAITKRFAAHRRLMILSFALTFAGVTLRLYLPLALIDLKSFSQVYAWIAWACWVPNLAVGLWIARKA